MIRTLFVLLSLASISTAQEWRDHGTAKPVVAWASHYAETDYRLSGIWRPWDHCDLEWDCIRDLSEMQEFRMDFGLYEDWCGVDWFKHGLLYAPEETVKIFERGGACIARTRSHRVPYLCYPDSPSYHMFDPIHFTWPSGGDCIE